MLRASIGRCSSSAHDEDYGILGIGILENEEFDLIKDTPVDYKILIRELHIRVSKYVISTCGKVDILNLKTIVPRATPLIGPENFPAWAQDFRGKPVYGETRWVTIDVGKQGLHRPSASGSSKASVSVDTSDKLRLRGIFVDRIAEVVDEDAYSGFELDLAQDLTHPRRSLNFESETDYIGLAHPQCHILDLDGSRVSCCPAKAVDRQL